MCFSLRVAAAFGMPLLLAGIANAAIIAQWDYNSDTSDVDPSFGVGVQSLQGGATYPGPVNVDYLKLKVNDVGDGLGWAVSTMGYTDVVVSLGVRIWNGYSQGRDWTWEYSVGKGWIDGPDFHIDSYSSQWDVETFDLAGFAGVENNAQFAVRVVTTTGISLANGQTPNFDDVTVSGVVPEPASGLALVGLIGWFARRRR